MESSACASSSRDKVVLVKQCTCLEQQLLQARNAAPVFEVLCVHRLCTRGGYERLQLLQQLW